MYELVDLEFDKEIEKRSNSLKKIILDFVICDSLVWIYEWF